MKDLSNEDLLELYNSLLSFIDNLKNIKEKSEKDEG